MDPSLPGYALDPSKCSKLNITEKRELVCNLLKWSKVGSEMLQSWSRKDLLEILCAEMGKERKYTGVTKQKLIEHLIKIVSEKKSGERAEELNSPSHQIPSNNQTSSKRQRKTDHPSRLPIAASNAPLSNETTQCRNIACRAATGPGDTFCRRCSCCICHAYDDNKDPSLWLVCSSDPPSEGDSCGMSCHLECALTDERTGFAKSNQDERLDGCFYCVSCRKTNDLMRCWRKQLLIAKDARRVDTLCYRISLGHKILDGTEKYQNLHQIVVSAMEKLEAEVGPLNDLPTGMARGIVNRLSCGSEVQKLCIHATESLDSLLSPDSGLCVEPKLPKSSLVSSTLIKFEDVSSTSLSVILGSEDNEQSSDVDGYALWHRRADAAEYPSEPTCKLIKPLREFIISELTPATEYFFKVVAFSNEKDVEKWEVGHTTPSIPSEFPKNFPTEGSSPTPQTNSSGLSNPSEGDESNNAAAYGDLNKLPEDCVAHCAKIEVPDLELSGHEKENGSHSNGTQEGAPGCSVSALDEEHNATTIQAASNKDSTGQNHASDIVKLENGVKSPAENEMVVVPYRHLESVLPVTPSKLEASKEAAGRNGKTKVGSEGLEELFPKPAKEVTSGSSSKRKTPENVEEAMIKDGCSSEANYKYCVKVIRWLECTGHIETNFRLKFLTWFSLRASPQERKVVGVFVDTLIDDPPSLAGQLADTFSESINSKRPPPVPTGFCMKLWH